MISINDMFLAGGYKNCKGEENHDSAEKQMAWLQTQLDQARIHHERVWIIGHIPPGVSAFATFLQQLKKRNLCTVEGKANTYMPTERLGEILAKNADVIKLAVFGHTHVDELKLVQGPNGTAFPLKITPALTTIGGNLPSFTVARVDVDTAQIADYTMISAPEKEGHTWSKEYTFSEAYGYKGLSAESVRSLIADLRNDPGMESKKSQDYVLNWSVGAVRNQVQPAWPGYVCSMDKLNPSAYKQCVCESPLGLFLR
jgi:sphingomyelin phosphodiesterase acid-like 3